MPSRQRQPRSPGPLRWAFAVLVAVSICGLLTIATAMTIAWAMGQGIGTSSIAVVLTSMLLLGLFLHRTLTPRPRLGQMLHDAEPDPDPPSARRWIRYLTGRER